LFEGTPAQMLDSLDRIARLPAATRICCGHEYTLANCAFARTIEPDNVALARRTTESSALRARGEPTLPSTLGSELACNPFLRIDAPALVEAFGAGSRVERFASLRERKDAFRVPAR
jgi:hydroxyacylglutathione hydrolase